MTRILLTACFFTVLCEGIGAFTMKLMRIEVRGFAAPIGFAILLCMLQLFYYPAQLAGLPFLWIVTVTGIIVTAGIVLTVMSIQDVWKHLFQKDTLIVLASAFVFLYVLSENGMNQSAESSALLSFISGNVNISHLNASAGSAGEGILFQGYYHFGSFFTWLVNVPYYLMHSSERIVSETVSVWGLGLLYSLISSMFIINMVRCFKFRNHWLEFCILIFTLGYTNFYSWKVSSAFSGETWRSLFTAMMLYVIYRWMKEDNEQIKYLLIYISAAGIACSGSFLFLSFEILYCLAAYLFRKCRIRSLFDLISFLTPLSVYLSALLSRNHAGLAWTLFLLYTVLLFIRYRKPVRRAISRSEEFCFEHAVPVFYIGVPVLFAVGSAAIRFLNPESVNYYLNYFANYTLTDNVKDYLFVYSGWLDNILNILRWVGVVLIFVFAKTKEDDCIRNVLLIMLAFFLNPLCTILLSKTVTGALYYRAFEILFNPFTETLFLYSIYKVLEWQPVGQWILELFLCAATVLTQAEYCLGFRIAAVPEKTNECTVTEIQTEKTDGIV